MPKRNPKHEARLTRKTHQKSTSGLRFRNLSFRSKIFIGITCVVLIGLGIWFFAVPKEYVRWGNTVTVYLEMYNEEGVLIEKSPDSGYVLVVSQDQEPTALFQSFYGKVKGQQYTLEIPACPSLECVKYGGFTMGVHAWQYLRYVLRIINYV